MAWDWEKFAEGTAKGGMDVLQMELMKGLFKEIGRPEGGDKAAECAAAGWVFDPVTQKCDPPGQQGGPDVRRPNQPPQPTAAPRQLPGHTNFGNFQGMPNFPGKKTWT
jgi:hypothetical protein